MRELAVKEIAPHHGHFFEELGSSEDVYEGHFNGRATNPSSLAASRTARS